MFCTGFALRATCSACLPLVWSVAWLCRSFLVFSPALSVRWGLGPCSALGGAMTQLLYLVMGRPGSMTGKTLPLRSESGRSAPPLSSFVRLNYQLGIADKKSYGCDYYLGSTARNSVYLHPSVGCCKPLPLSPSQSDSQWLHLTDIPAILMGQDQSRSSHCYFIFFFSILKI